MMRPDRRRALLALLLGPGMLRAQIADEHLSPLVDLRAVSNAVARFKAPLLVLFSTPGCPFCREVRRNYLVPRVDEQAGRAMPELLLYETDITSERTIIDLAGARITEVVFARRYHVRVVPVVALLDASMRQLVEPLVGLDRSGFYEGYLTSALDAARKHLRQNS